MLIGYARVSTQDQDPEAQADALKEAGCALIFRETASGGRWDRPELHRLLERLRPGDVVVVWKLDRLSRSLRDVLTLMERLETAGAGFRSLTEAIDTTSAAGDRVHGCTCEHLEFPRELFGFHSCCSAPGCAFDIVYAGLGCSPGSPALVSVSGLLSSLPFVGEQQRSKPSTFFKEENKISNAQPGRVTLQTIAHWRPAPRRPRQPTITKPRKRPRLPAAGANPPPFLWPPVPGRVDSAGFQQRSP